MNHDNKPLEASCITCGKSFRRIRSDMIYCSQRCGKSVKSKRNRISSPPRQCVECGIEFRSMRNVITCSVACSMKRHKRIKAESERRRNNARPKLFTRTCIVCEKSFDTNIKRKITCSVDCAAKNTLKKARIRNQKNYLRKETRTREKQKICVYCNNKFTSISKGRTCCSDACASKMRQKGQSTAIDKRRAKAGEVKTVLRPVVAIPSSIECPCCHTLISRDASILGCCSSNCADQLQKLLAVKSITDVVEVGSRVIVTSWQRMNIGGMERLVSSGDAGIVTRIDGDVTIIRSENSDFRFLISDIVTTPDIVQVVKKRIADMETWRGKFRDHKQAAISG